MPAIAILTATITMKTRSKAYIIAKMTATTSLIIISSTSVIINEIGTISDVKDVYNKMK
jgi:hypothetical protein